MTLAFGRHHFNYYPTTRYKEGNKKREREREKKNLFFCNRPEPELLRTPHFEHLDQGAVVDHTAYPVPGTIIDRTMPCILSEVLAGAPTEVFGYITCVKEEIPELHHGERQDN